ncbi:MAG: transpeptidase family protein [Muribaculaceae bacterium]|nr:transpeptidase family protein [Muribaculaceae bacterium]
MSSKPSSKSKSNPDTSGSSGYSHFRVLGRYVIVLALVLLAAVWIIYNLLSNTVVHGSAFEEKGRARLSDTIKSAPMRGEILASDGSILATNLSYYDMRIDFRAPRFKIVEYHDSIGLLADSLAKYFRQRTREGWEAYLRKPLKDSVQNRSRSFLLLRAVPEDMMLKVKHTFPFFRGFKKATQHGLKAESVIRRSYPYGDMAALSIGRVGEVAGGEIHGISGLEKALDSLLYGTPGIRTKRMFTRGAGYWDEVPAQAGTSLITTIDITMQDILEYELGEMLIKANADWGTAILMETATGDIKAISNLERDTLSATPRCIEAMNRAVLAYEPGSVMKVMTMAVALNKGFAKPLDRMYNIGHSYAYLGRKPISDTHSPAQLPVSRFMEYSSNIGMVKLTMPQYESDPNRFRADLAELGFFDRFNTGIARERPPYFPKLENNVGGRLNLSRMVFGYTTQIPPLYTCAFYNAIANDGRFVRPRLVKGHRLADGRDSMLEVSYVRDRILSSEDAATLRKMMHDVVWEQGGTAKRLKDPIVEIAGKTGTCRLAKEAPRDSTGKRIPGIPFTGGYLEGRYRVTFCGFFPYENPKYTCIVVVSDPRGAYRGAAGSSGEVVRNVARKLYSRGLFDDSREFAPSADDKPAGATPTIYASFNAERSARLHNNLKMRTSRTIIRPDNVSQPRKENSVPDVRGVGLREALAALEQAGYAVNFQGIGYVEEQNPMPGTQLAPGSKVNLRLRQLQ